MATNGLRYGRVFFTLLFAWGLLYVGGWSFEHITSDSSIMYITDSKLLDAGYIGIKNDSGWYGITPSDRFFRFGWLSWITGIAGGGLNLLIIFFLFCTVVGIEPFPEKG